MCLCVFCMRMSIEWALNFATFSHHRRTRWCSAKIKRRGNFHRSLSSYQMSYEHRISEPPTSLLHQQNTTIIPRKIVLYNPSWIFSWLLFTCKVLQLLCSLFFSLSLFFHIQINFFLSYKHFLVITFANEFQLTVTK